MKKTVTVTVEINAVDDQFATWQVEQAIKHGLGWLVVRYYTDAELVKIEEVEPFNTTIERS